MCATGIQHFSSAASSVEQAVAIADERMSLMPGVAARKWQTQAAIADPEREKVVISRAVALAGTMGLAPEGIQELFELQVREARESEERLTQQWHATGFDFKQPIPD
ncbi:MAG TPA: chorismate mutase, partial [Steroidobacteraceae bacterium]|nr:chorismate mutase [Steroidobacteraceae bacterium]